MPDVVANRCGREHLFVFNANHYNTQKLLCQPLFEIFSKKIFEFFAMGKAIESAKRKQRKSDQGVV